MGDQDFFGFLERKGEVFKRAFQLFAEQHEIGQRIVEGSVVVFHFVEGLMARGLNPRRVGVS